MTSPDENLQVVVYRLDSLDKQVSDLRRHLDNKFASLNFVHKDSYSVEQLALKDRVSQLEDKARWLSRTVSGSLIAALISALFTIFATRGGV